MGNLRVYFNNLEAQNYWMDLFQREEALTSRAEIKALIENVESSKSENEAKSKEFIEKLGSLAKEIDSMKTKVEKEMIEVYEGKIHAWAEKLKKQNQELWEESVRHIKTDFKEIGS